jgi:hypothetical protein
MGTSWSRDPLGFQHFTPSLLWQTCAPICMPCPIGLPYFTLSLLWQTCVSLCMPRQIGLPYLTLSLRWLAFTPFTFSCCWLMPFLILTRLWHCLCCCRNSSCSCNRHDTNPPWYTLKASCCREGMPKRFCNDDTITMVWIFLRCETQTWKQYQTCRVVVNSMLRQQGGNTVIVCQSCYAIAKQVDSHFI